MPPPKEYRIKRNVWTSDEVIVFIELIKEKHTMGLMDGKRIRVTDLFKTLTAPMKSAGFQRDVSQLIIKWKNLKGEYYKCKRLNVGFEHFDALDEILGQRPTTQSLDFDPTATTQPILEVIKEEVEDMPIDEITWKYKDVPDVDGAIPGGSTTPGILRSASPSSSASRRSQSPPAPSKKPRKPAEALLKMQEEFFYTLKEIREQEAEADREFLNVFLKKQEEMMLKCTAMMMSGLKDIFSKDSDEV